MGVFMDGLEKHGLVEEAKEQLAEHGVDDPQDWLHRMDDVVEDSRGTKNDLAKPNLKEVLKALYRTAAVNIPPGEDYQYVYFRTNNGKVRPNYPYQGEMELARLGAGVHRIEAGVVYEGDQFEVVHGPPSSGSGSSYKDWKHKPNYNGDRGDRQLAYAMAVFEDGTWTMTVVDSDTVEESRKKGSDHTWDKHTDDMWKKTAVHKLNKYLPHRRETKSALGGDNELYDDEDESVSHDSSANEKSRENLGIEDNGGESSSDGDGEEESNTSSQEPSEASQDGDTSDSSDKSSEEPPFDPNNVEGGGSEKPPQAESASDTSDSDSQKEKSDSSESESDDSDEDDEPSVPWE